MIGGRDQNEAQRAMLKSDVSRVIDENDHGIVIVVRVDDAGRLSGNARRGGRRRDPVLFGEMCEAVVFALADLIRQDRGQRGAFTELRSDGRPQDGDG